MKSERFLPVVSSLLKANKLRKLYARAYSPTGWLRHCKAILRIIYSMKSINAGHPRGFILILKHMLQHLNVLKWSLTWHQYCSAIKWWTSILAQNWLLKKCHENARKKTFFSLHVSNFSRGAYPQTPLAARAFLPRLVFKSSYGPASVWRWRNLQIVNNLRVILSISCWHSGFSWGFVLKSSSKSI